MCQAYDAEYRYMCHLEKTVGRCESCGFLVPHCWCYFNASQPREKRHYADSYYRKRGMVDVLEAKRARGES